MSERWSKQRDADIMRCLAAVVSDFGTTRKKLGDAAITPAMVRKFEADYDRFDKMLIEERAKLTAERSESAGRSAAARPATDSIHYRGGMLESVDDPQTTFTRAKMDTHGMLDLDARSLAPNETMAERVRRDAAEDHSNDFDFGDLIRAKTLGPSTSREKRALAVGIDVAGGFLVPNFLSAQIIDLLRPQNTLFRAGCGIVDLPGFASAYARILSDSTSGPHPENQEIPPGPPTFGRIQLAARTIVSLVAPVSEELIRSAPNVGEVIMQNISKSMSQEIDRQGLFGTGAGDEMTGLVNVAGTLTVPAGGVNGGSAGDFYDLALDARQALLTANAPEPKSCIYSIREDTLRAKLKDSQGRPLEPPPQIAGLNYFATTKVPVTESYGTARNASRMVLGDFSNCAVGFLVRIQIRTLQERYQSQLAYGFVAFTMLDFLVYQPTAFCQVKGIIPG